jgi:hypothetical protein
MTSWHLASGVQHVMRLLVKSSEVINWPRAPCCNPQVRAAVRAADLVGEVTVAGEGDEEEEERYSINSSSTWLT